jgi:nucleoside diphosphate kinase/uncharacterized Fe-S cluster-containing radical SAM superfamily protein
MKFGIPFHTLSRFVHTLFVFVLTYSLILPSHFVYAQAVPLTSVKMPEMGTAVGLSAAFEPMTIRGVNLKADNPFAFDFIVDNGDADLDDTQYRTEAQKLIKYFLTSLTVPEREMWVNLSPYEAHRIIPEGFGRTLMGRDLLVLDYMLKQLSASLMYPDGDIGEQFWDSVYSKALDQFGTTDIPVDTFNKIWIVPASADIYEHEQGALILDSSLKVMLEEDYLAQEANRGRTDHGLGDVQAGDLRGFTHVTAQVVREVILPQIEHEVNTGTTFAPLRQIFSSMILASWYKDALKESYLMKAYGDQSKTGGLETDAAYQQEVYGQYVDAFKQGVYDIIKEDYDPVAQEFVAKKYFSGGVGFEKTRDVVNVQTDNHYLKKILTDLQTEGSIISTESQQTFVELKTIDALREVYQGLVDDIDRGEVTLVVMKPNTITEGKEQAVIDFYTQRLGMDMILGPKMDLSEQTVDTVYGDVHGSKPFYPQLKNFMLSGPVRLAFVRKNTQLWPSQSGQEAWQVSKQNIQTLRLQLAGEDLLDETENYVHTTGPEPDIGYPKASERIKREAEAVLEQDINNSNDITVQIRHEREHLPKMAEMLAPYKEELDGLLDDYFHALDDEDRSRQAELEDRIGEIVDAANVDRDIAAIAEAGDFSQADTLTVEDFQGLESGAVYEEYLDKAKRAIVEGDYVPEFLFAGKATRLNKGPMYGIDLWEIAQDKNPELEESEYSIGMGPRQILAYRMYVENAARELGVNVDETLSQQRIVIHLNDEVEASMLEDLRAQNYYGFNPENIYFINQPEFNGARLTDDGDLEDVPGSRRLVYGHGDNVIQLSAEGEAYQVSAAGEKTYLSGDVLTALGDRYVASHRVNDMTKYSAATVVDTEKLAMGMYLQDQGHQIVADLVDNPNRQKGGTAVKTADGRQLLFEKLAAQGNEALMDVIAEMGEAGAPYNAFRLLYRADRLKGLLEKHDLPYYMRFKDGYWYMEAVTGDLTQFGDANTAFVRREGDRINDYKKASDAEVEASIEVLRAQNAELVAAGYGPELFRDKAELRHEREHLPKMAEMLAPYKEELGQLMDDYFHALDDEDRSRQAELEDRIGEIVDAANVDRDIAAIAEAGDFSQADTLTVEDFQGLESGAVYEEYLDKAKRAIVEGDYVPEFLFAGKATRLNKGPMYGIDLWEIAQDKNPELEESEYSIGMGPRQILAYRMYVENAARELGVNVDETLSQQRIVIHLNDEVEASMLEDLRAQNYYGFNPENIYFINQPEFNGARLTDDGDLEDVPGSRRLVYGHGDNVIQLSAEGEAYQVSAAGEKTYLSGDVLTALGDRYVASHRVNDMTKYSAATVVDTEKLAMGMYLQDQGHQIVADLVDNPNRQKGGTAVKTADGRQLLFEKLAAQGNEALMDVIAEMGEAGAPYNAFRLLYRADRLKGLLEKHDLPYYMRFKDGYWYMEAVTGDLTQFGDANTAFVRREGDRINDYKKASDAEVEASIEVLRAQNAELAAAGYGPELFRDKAELRHEREHLPKMAEMLAPYKEELGWSCWMIIFMH